MTFSKSDLPYIQWPLLSFFLILSLGSVAIMLSASYTTQANHNQQTAQRQLSEARSRLAAAQDDRQNMATYALEYNELLQRKIIGNDQRLDWIEDLEKLHRQNSVLDFKYTISPQQPYLPAPPLDSGSFDLKLSPMSLQFDLLHEQQLINFLDMLRSSKGWFVIDHCALTRNSTAPDNNLAPHLKAECGGGWLTLHNRNAK
ncbi:MAG: hypothetical protein Q7S51_02840 [Gallionellaceae bacterium]|nr:hypothetical protein [Gallionellaceae bacterium]